MQKTLIIILFFLLTSCHVNKKNVSCTLFKNDRDIDIYISADNDLIKSVSINQTYTLAYELLLNEKRFEVLKSQLDETFEIIDNKLIKKDDIEIDDTYSLEETLRALRRERYNCE